MKHDMRKSSKLVDLQICSTQQLNPQYNKLGHPHTHYTSPTCPRLPNVQNSQI